MKNPLMAIGVFVALTVGAGVGGYQLGESVSGVKSKGAAPAPSSIPVAHVGEQAYGANCAGCHGARGEGAMGPKLAGLLSDWSAEGFERAVIDGTKPSGEALAPLMPRFKGNWLTDEELEALYDFVKGL